ncbi:MAG: hypothetical protein AB7G12_10375 [Thermoanaerobaculia bacterium]
MSVPASKRRHRVDPRDDPYEAPDAYAGAYDFDVSGEDPSIIDELIDDLIPPEVNWRRLVRRHPWPTLLVAGLGGYLLGRSQGRALVSALAGMAAARVEERFLGAVADEVEADDE